MIYTTTFKSSYSVKKPKIYQNMKQKVSVVISFFVLLFVFFSCVFISPSIQGNGNVTEENRKTGDFERIEVSRGINVYISQGENIRVKVVADENLMDIIETFNEGDKLIVTAKQNIQHAKSKKVFVTAPKITQIKSSSGSNIFSETKIISKDLELSTSSGSNMSLQTNTSL